MSAFAALVLVGVASSCRDQNFDWDEAHANSVQQKFTNVFIEEFGKPAAGHRWGFDLAWESATRSAMPITRAGLLPDVDGWTPTKEVNKWESEYNENILHYDTVPNITEREHKEVYEWFLTHQVTWENTSDKDHAVKCVNGTSTKNTDGTIAVKRAELSEGNSLLTNMTGNLAYWLDSPEVGLTINFRHAHIQNVASSMQFKDPTVFDAFNPGKSTLTDTERLQLLQDIKELSVPECNNGTSTDYTTTTSMNYLEFYRADKSQIHTNDFNTQGTTGYGWGNQSLHSIDMGGGHNEDHYMNSVLICGADFNNTTYQSSVSSSSHQDKWIIVYLKGADYEGWYLGFDLEGSGDAQARLGANGFCNNWIIKLTSVDKSTSSHFTRLMCEDLGAVYNNSNGSDIDYNDIVLDVNYSVFKSVQAPSGISIPSSAIPTRAELKLTPVAAGGTLPLIVTCGDQTLFEVHEFLEQGRTFIGSNSQPASSHTASEESVYKLMINTDGISENLNTGYSNDEFSPKTFTVKFASRGTITGETLLYSSVAAPSWDDLIGSQEENNMLQVKVYRFDCADYRANPLSTANNPAYWVNLGNQESEAPVMLCVPQTTNWLKERHKISDGYGGFTTWVVKPSSNPLWADEDHGTVTASHLYKGLSVAPTYTIDGGFSNSGTSGTGSSGSGSSGSGESGNYGTQITVTNKIILGSSLPKPDEGRSLTIKLVYEGVNNKPGIRFVNSAWKSYNPSEPENPKDGVVMVSFVIPSADITDSEKFTIYEDYTVDLTFVGAFY